MFTSGISRAEDIPVSTVLQSQALPQLMGGQREVAHGHVGPRDAADGSSQFLFIHGGDCIDSKAAAGEILDMFIGYKKMTVSR